jgi:hypothetical protein
MKCIKLGFEGLPNPGFIGLKNLSLDTCLNGIFSISITTVVNYYRSTNWLFYIFVYKFNGIVTASSSLKAQQ